ncbi:MAG: galactose oxidase early set domain-containing protein, partial [Pseudomonadota bacterium]
MGWRPVTASTETVAIHAALLPTGQAGQIMCMGDWVGHRPVSTAFTYWQIYDIDQDDIVINADLSTDLEAEGLTAPDTNAFCCGQAWLADGRWLCAGGTVGFSQEGHHAAAEHYDGERACWIFQPQEGTWVSTTDLNFHPGGTDTGGGRWYPTLVTLGDGQIWATAGHPNADDTYQLRHNNNTPERYLPGSATWVLMNNDITAPHEENTDSYPRYRLMPDGWLFCDTLGNEGTKRFFDPIGSVWGGPDVDTSALPGYYNRGSAGTSVLLPLQPPNYQPRVLAANSPTDRFFRIDPAADNPTWTTTAPRQGPAAGENRENGCAVLLPTGEVLLVGGWPRDTDDTLSTSTRFPELYRSGIDWSTGLYSGSDSWGTLDDPDDEATIPRGYHFTAVLMPNGSVFTAGSTASGEFNAELGIEIYDPSYVGQARPTLSSAPHVINYNRSYSVQVSGTISRVALMRCGSMTHGFDSDQRYVGVTFEQNGNTVEFTSPPHGNIAPPGPYMLWVIDDNGRPCEQAAFVRLAPLDCEIGLERNTFSLLEVEAMLSEPDDGLAVFHEAIFFHFDGFRAAELGVPGSEPTVELFVGASPGSAPEGMSMRLSSTNFESGTPHPDRAQRFTFRYDVRFANLDAFGFGGTDRTLTVRATLGGETCVGQLRLMKARNPYMLDGDPHWLSRDLRVFSIKPGEHVGTTQFTLGDSPESFLERLLTDFEAEAETEEHPFEDQLRTGQQASALELATTLDGDPVYNFAIAKVRYRALSTPASDVRVIFRLFNTVGPALEWTSGTTYRREIKGANGRDTVGLLGMTGGSQGEIVSIPFFATPRYTPSQSARDQEDPLNRRDVAAMGATESTAYFGCWLDINQDEHHFPYYPNGDGPYQEDPLAGGPLRSVFDSIRNYHQCLVAEIYYEEDPINFGDTPGASDNLSQRNLVLETSSTPGNAASRTIHSTMMIQPSKTAAVALAATTAAAGRLRPDELIIWWHTLPEGTEIDLYIPSIEADRILAMAGLRPNGNPLQKIDAHTLRASYGDVTFIPIPGGLNKPIPCLISIRLPSGVTAGDTHRAVVQQIAGRSRLILGGIEFRIPVDHAPNFLDHEIRKLSILRAIQLKMDKNDRWWPVFERYLEGIAGRVDGLGGDASS